MHQLDCEFCGSEFEAKTKRARFCKQKDCQRARARARKQKQRSPATVTELPRPEGGAVDDSDDSVFAATRAQLEAADRLRTPTGAAALALAKRIDSGSFADTGSSFAAVVKELRATLGEALADAAVPDDPVDELRARREARRAGNG